MRPVASLLPTDQIAPSLRRVTIAAMDNGKNILVAAETELRATGDDDA